MEILSFKAVHFPTGRVFRLLDQDDVSDLKTLVSTESWRDTVAVMVDRDNMYALEEKDYGYLDDALHLYWTRVVKDTKEALLFLSAVSRLTNREQQLVVLVQLLEEPAFSLNPAHAICMTLCHDAVFIEGTTPKDIGRGLFLAHFARSDESPESWEPYWDELGMATILAMLSISLPNWTYEACHKKLSEIISTFCDDKGYLDRPRLMTALFRENRPTRMSQKKRESLSNFFDARRFGEDLMKGYETLKSERFNGTVFMMSKEKVPLVEIC